MQATAELVAFFDDLGYRRLGRSLKIVYHDQFVGSLDDVSLVCIGGPDANEVTKYILKRINHTIEPGDPERHEVSFRDTKTGTRYCPSTEQSRRRPWLARRGARETITVDYGLLIKAPSPFDPSRGVIIVAGSFGYGTWAGIKLARSKQFLRASLISQGAAVECLYKTQVINEIPQEPEISIIRQICQ